MRKIISGVYEIRHKSSDKRYIGSSRDVGKRWTTHLSLLKSGVHHSNYLQNSWNKYGPTKFSFKIIEECEISSLLTREQYWIDTIHPAYNMNPTAANCAGRVHTSEARANMAASQRGRTHTLETKAKMSAARRNPSAETRAKLSAAARARPPISAETRARISAALRARPPASAETRAKISAAKTRMWAERRASPKT